MLGRGETIHEIDRRGEIGIRALYRQIVFSRVDAGKRHPLDPRADRKIISLLLPPVRERNIVGIGRKRIRIAEQTVEFRILIEGIYKVIGIVDRPAVIIIVAVIQLQDGMPG